MDEHATSLTSAWPGTTTVLAFKSSALARTSRLPATKPAVPLRRFFTLDRHARCTYQPPRQPLLPPLSLSRHWRRPGQYGPAFVQRKINRAQQDAPEVSAEGCAVAFPPRSRRLSVGGVSAGPRAEWLRPGKTESTARLFLCGPRSGIGRSNADAATDLPYAEDPTLWSVLELVAGEPE